MAKSKKSPRKKKSQSASTNNGPTDTASTDITAGRGIYEPSSSLKAAAYESACDPWGDTSCLAPLRPLDIKLAPHSKDPRFPSMRGQSKPTERKTGCYGWIPDLPDVRDHMYATPFALSLPRQFDLRDHCAPFPPVYDQGLLGSCTANALAGAIQFERMRQRLPWSEQIPSRLFIYYNERILEGTAEHDHGAQLRDGIKSIVHNGACFEGNSPGQWPYDINAVTTAPSPACYAMALKDRVIGYSRLHQTYEQMRGCLASGFPFVFGFTAYESLKDAASGKIPLPSANEAAIGGHTVMAIGYDDAAQKFIIRNSWGSGWGKKGYGSMPYAYLTNSNLARDFWTIRLMSLNTGKSPATKSNE